MRTAARLYDQGWLCRVEANMAKERAVACGFEVADQALLTLGGFGYAREFDLDRSWREVRVIRLAPVTPAMVLNFLTQRELGLPRSYRP